MNTERAAYLGKLHGTAQCGHKHSDATYLKCYAEMSSGEKEYRGFTHAELSWAFDLVKPEQNWKMPIKCSIEAVPERCVEAIRAAVVFYTGGNVDIRPNGVHPSGVQVLAVSGPGYYMSVGA